MLNSSRKHSQKPDDDQGTKERLLSTALRMFAESGFDAVSIRDLTNAANANLGAVGYHFGSKDGIIQAVLKLAEPINARRLQALEECEREAGSGGATVEQIIRALVEPAVRLARDTTGDGFYFSRIYRIASALRPPIVLEVIRAQYDKIALRFIDALARALPEIPRTVIVWRYISAVGAMLHVVDDASLMNRVLKFSEGRGDASDPDQIIDALIPFLIGGISAPLLTKPPAKATLSRSAVKRRVRRR